MDKPRDSDPTGLPAPAEPFAGLPKALPRPPLTESAPRVSPGPLAGVAWGIAGALAAAFVWGAANFAFHVDGLGLLERLGWPFSSVGFCVAAGAVMGGIAGIVAHVRALRHAGEVADASEALGLSYAAVVEPELMQVYRSLRLFAGGSAACNGTGGYVDGVSVEVVDYTFVEKGGGDGDNTHHQTVVLLPAEEGTPRFELPPRSVAGIMLGWLGAGGVAIQAKSAASAAERETVARFNELYFLSEGPGGVLPGRARGEEDGDGRAAVRRCFTPNLLAFFAASPGWCVESDGRHLAVWRPDLIAPANERAALVRDALGVRRALGEGGGDPIGPATGTAAAEDSSHVIARMAGTILGAIAGLFIGGIAGVVSLFWLDPFKPGGMGFKPMIFVYGPLGGFALGAFLGNRLLYYPVCAVLRNHARHKR